MTEEYNKYERPIVLLHGLGPPKIVHGAMWPLKMYLKHVGGYKNIFHVAYDVNEIPFEEALSKLNIQLEGILNKDNDEPIIIGQSMGGVIANNLHKMGWTIHKTISIGSPLHGANILNMMENALPTSVVTKMKRKSYEYLMTKEREEPPPHEYHTISAAWPRPVTKFIHAVLGMFTTTPQWENFRDFDGCVFIDETKYCDENHTHIAWADHRTVVAGPRLWTVVLNKINHNSEST